MKSKIKEWAEGHFTVSELKKVKSEMHLRLNVSTHTMMSYWQARLNMPEKQRLRTFEYFRELRPKVKMSDLFEEAHKL